MTLLRITKQMLKDCQAIHRIVAAMPYVHDVGDSWRVVKDLSGGDCDDYTLTFLWMVETAYPQYAGALSLAECWVEPDPKTGISRGYHLVALLEGSNGTYVSDNRSKYYLEEYSTLVKRGYVFTRKWSIEKKAWVSVPGGPNE